MSLESSMLALLRANIQATPALKRWVVAYSGGLDSTVLLSLVSEVNQQLSKPLSITALHINHKLSESADAWQHHCQAFAASLGVEFVSEVVEVERVGQGLEAAAREARYSVFEKCLMADDLLLIGHHSDDQAETVLLRMMRGAGILGLSAIPQERALGQSRLQRPLLNVSREELMRYAKQHQLSWVEDESNLSDDFDRNYLRNRIMPLLMERWPQANKQLTKAATHLLQAQHLLNDLAENDLAAVDQRRERYGVSVDWKQVKQLSEERINNLLRRWCGLQSLNAPDSQQLKQVHEQFFRATSTLTSAVVSWAGDVELRQFNQRLYLMRALPKFVAPEESVCWDCHQPINIAVAGNLSLISQSNEAPIKNALSQSRLFDSSVTVRWRSGGERCTPIGRSSSQTVKKLLQEYQLETWLRDRVPLIYIDDQLAAVGDLWVCQGFEASEGEESVQINWLINER